MEESYEQMVARSYEWYRNSFPGWADSDCRIMAARDVEAQLERDNQAY